MGSGKLKRPFSSTIAKLSDVLNEELKSACFAESGAPNLYRVLEGEKRDFSPAQSNFSMSKFDNFESGQVKEAGLGFNRVVTLKHKEAKSMSGNFQTCHEASSFIELASKAVNSILNKDSLTANDVEDMKVLTSTINHVSVWTGAATLSGYANLALAVRDSCLSKSHLDMSSKQKLRQASLGQTEMFGKEYYSVVSEWRGSSGRLVDSMKGMLNASRPRKTMHPFRAGKRRGSFHKRSTKSNRGQGYKSKAFPSTSTTTIKTEKRS